ncbi:hypothetical protein P8629_01770 [Hydrogenovibrio sp. 3SP14C1]|uniref:hypothetical protein n=1 Tax=Hydrogenovibrio sp. 3SP14C1 TaxID=3038774 RepID=UPI002416C491|nr:hypothetical protein [Hydrogenovibrio sp. 3SP14C1]MDG4811725.1 hypothetical protein [Hydrogenovibrio sp. 3SP14C1]
MPFWFEKHEMRRFRRVDIPVKIYIKPHEAIKDQQIFAYGIDYFPPTKRKKIKEAQQEMHHWVGLIQEQKDILQPFFEEFETYIEFFKDWVQALSEGRSPRASKQDWLTFHAYGKGVQKIQTLKVSAPKTFQYFDHLNQKLMAHFQHVAKCAEQSSPSQFVQPEPVAKHFAVDDMKKRFESSTVSKAPLIQALCSLYLYMSYTFDAYEELIEDLCLEHSSSSFREDAEVNLSAGGLSIKLDKRYKPNMRCNIGLYFAGSKRLLKFRSTLVRAFSVPEFQAECNAFNFDFPNGHDQHLIQMEIERYEIESSMKVSL